MNIEIIKSDPIESNEFNNFIQLIGLEFTKWEEEKHEKKKETGSSEVLL